MTQHLHRPGSLWEDNVDALMDGNGKKALAETIAHALMILNQDRLNWTKVQDARRVLERAITK